MDAVFDGWLSFKSWFWDRSFWLPPTITWEDLERNETVLYPAASDMFYPIPIAVCMILVRLLWERFVAVPIGRMYKLRETVSRRAEPNVVLEKLYKQHRKRLPSRSVIMVVVKQLDWTEQQIERWWRHRRLQDKPSEMQRFRETSWRFLFYFLAFIFGLYTVIDKPWFWDTKHCWYNYPKQPITRDMWWYYMLEMGFYWSLVMSLFMDIRRKDFAEMMIHHFATLTLMAMSFSTNVMRVGTLVLVVHDAVDYILEFAKMAVYCKYGRVCDILFVVFALVFFVTRLVIYPFWILRTTLFEATTIVGMAPIYYAYNGLLCILQVLHIFWFCTILKMAWSFVTVGKVEKDARSDSEVDGSDAENEKSGGDVRNGFTKGNQSYVNKRSVHEN